MASLKESAEESTENSDLAAVQQLVFSVGHLKFCLRSLSSMHLQSALHSQKETDPPTRFAPLESNAVLENVINEVSSAKEEESDKSTGASNVDQTQKSVSVEDLEIVQKKLQEELERRRHRFLESLTNRMQTMKKNK